VAEDAGYQGELLPLDEIYRAAGIANPRGNYSIVKIAEMLQSEHLRGLAKDMRRASVMMALDAAGVPIHEVLRDAKTRMEAIEAYEAEQHKLCEAEWVRKEEENIQIRAELERVKAQYMARINRNLEAVAREKARFAAWQTTNQPKGTAETPASDRGRFTTRECRAEARHVHGTEDQPEGWPLQGIASGVGWSGRRPLGGR
jgi:hypothetical protein